MREVRSLRDRLARSSPKPPRAWRVGCRVCAGALKEGLSPNCAALRRSPARVGGFVVAAEGLAGEAFALAAEGAGLGEGLARAVAGVAGASLRRGEGCTRGAAGGSRLDFVARKAGRCSKESGRLGRSLPSEACCRSLACSEGGLCCAGGGRFPSRSKLGLRV